MRVELGLSPMEPPPLLYHGTAIGFIDSILREGLKPRSRLQVHLSVDEATALNVGRRHGAPVVLRIDAQRMYASGHKFYLADNGVWLTDQVAKEFITPADEARWVKSSGRPKR